MNRGDRPSGATSHPALFGGVYAGLDGAIMIVLAGQSDEIHCLHRLGAGPDRPDLRRFERYRALLGGLRDAIAAAGRPSAVAIEGCELIASRRYHMHVLEQGTLLRYALLVAGVAVTEVPPITVREFATGNSWARDPLMVERLAQGFGASLYGPDEAMAYALAQIARCLLHPDQYDSRRRAALAGVLPPIRSPGRAP